MYKTNYDDLYTPDGLGRMVEVMPSLVAACPRFVGWSDRYEDLRGMAPGSDAGLFAEYVVESLAQGDTQEVRAALEAIENLLLMAEGDIEDVIVVGFLEPLAGKLMDHGLTFESIRQYLGPTTMFWTSVPEIGPIGEA